MIVRTRLEGLRLRILIRFHCLLAVALLVSGCDMRQGLDELGPMSRAHASSAYLVYFGPAPVTPSGSYRAMAGFLPLANDFSKVGPFPLFIASSPEPMLRLVQRLVSVDSGVIAPLGLVNPFPHGTVVLSLRQQDDLVMVDLSRQAARQENFLVRRAMIMSLGHLLEQFPGVKRVMVSAEGVPLTSFGGLTYRPGPLQVVSPGPPRPVGVVGRWSGNIDKVDELAVWFDRPVSISDFHMSDDTGRVIVGNVNRQPFDMGVLLRPESSSVLREGMRIHVVWEAVDAIGDSSQGESIFHLRRLQTEN